MSNNYQKIIVIACINCISFSNGYVIGVMACLVRALKNKEDGVLISDGQISVIASAVLTYCIFGQGLAAFVSDKIGRRWSFIIFSVPPTITWIILYFARDMFAFMLSRVIAGIAIGALFSLKICVTSEYTGPNTRALFLNMISTLAPALGSATAHVLGIVLDWKTVALIGVLPSIFGSFIPYFWVESPHWLASKGRFEECEHSFRKLHGMSPKTETELELLIKVEKMKLQKAEETNSIKTFKKLLIACKKKYFWDLMLLSVFISAFLAAAGKLIFSSLAITIIEGLTGSSDVLFFTLLVNGFIITGASASCILITKMSIKTMLFTTGFISICVLVSLAACLYFKTESKIFQWVNVSLLSIYFLVVKSGPHPILETLLGEIFPLELKVHCFFLSGIVLMGLLSLTVGLIPMLVNVMGYHGLFLMNAAIKSVCLAYIWVRLPETKGRTLQEIELYFKTKTFHDIEEVLSNEQMKALI